MCHAVSVGWHIFIIIKFPRKRLSMISHFSKSMGDRFRWICGIVFESESMTNGGDLLLNPSTIFFHSWIVVLIAFPPRRRSTNECKWNEVDTELNGNQFKFSINKSADGWAEKRKKTDSSLMSRAEYAAQKYIFNIPMPLCRRWLNETRKTGKYSVCA